jgi:hypothetical protein
MTPQIARSQASNSTPLSHHQSPLEPTDASQSYGSWRGSKRAAHQLLLVYLLALEAKSHSVSPPPLLILSTLAFGAVTVTTGFDTAVPEDAPTFSGTSTPGTTLALGTDLAGVAFAIATFYEAAPMPFGATGAFRAAAFRPDAFACFPAGPAPASFFLFFTASLLASEPGTKRGP